MPTYTYKADNGEILEIEQSIHDDPITQVTDNTGETWFVRRVYTSAPATTFKGGGWARK